MVGLVQDLSRTVGEKSSKHDRRWLWWLELPSPSLRIRRNVIAQAGQMSSTQLSSCSCRQNYILSKRVVKSHRAQPSGTQSANKRLDCSPASSIGRSTKSAAPCVSDTMRPHASCHRSFPQPTLVLDKSSVSRGTCPLFD